MENTDFNLRNEESFTPPRSVITTVTRKDGSKAAFDEARVRQLLLEATIGFSDEVDYDMILSETFKNLYEGIPAKEVMQAAIMATRPYIERDPAYSYVTARLLCQVLYEEVIGHTVERAAREGAYRQYLTEYLNKGAEAGRLNPKLKTDFDLVRIAAALKPERDEKFSFLGLQTLYDRYFIHINDRRIEMPQIFWMRVAMGLALVEKDTATRTDKAIEFYDLFSNFDYVSSTPTLFNAGTPFSQLSSCFLTTIGDDLGEIYKCIRDNAMLSKFSGGLGNDWTQVRGLGAYISGTNGRSQGVVPFLKVANDTAVAVNQGGKRKGAVCAYLETWHIDVQEYLELRKNTGDDRRRTHDMNTANWIPDLFMQRVEKEAEWTLFSPEDVPDLHDLYGKAFETAYVAYEAKAARGEIKNFKKVEAVKLWRKMLSMVFETGHPWITFKDPSNLRSPQQHAGVVHSSNLCTEILLNTSDNEVAVCNLGSINLANHTIAGKGLDKEKLAKTTRTALRMLDNVIDQNFYPIPEAKNSNLKHRPVGLGLMGFQDALYKMRMPYDSDAAVEFADESMEFISYHAILASTELAAERGAYESFKGSLWDQGILPIDSIKLIDESRGETVDVDRSSRLDWTPVREAIKAHGMRNSNTMAIAPTATISNISNVCQSIEPTYKNLYVKSNLSGEFTVINPFLVEDLKKRNMWNMDTITELKKYDGNLDMITAIPEDLKALYKTAFDVAPEWLIRAAARRQKWIDMGQSLNLYIAAPNGKKLDAMYKYAWKTGLKTTYYLRSMGATGVEKSTITTREYNNVAPIVPAAEAKAREEFTPPMEKREPQLCSIDNPECEACQ
ncbi:MAG TPA: ribonucleoside-diphosphate reductase subunit alpha [Bdellovibrionota bacterium]|nr:ribonucleoside-diphosphate reductase subunit alpha [Bdellovibrionota bacterium]